MDIARGYFVTRCAVIPEGGLKLEVSDYGDYWMVEGCGKVLVNKKDGSLVEVK